MKIKLNQPTKIYIQADLIKEPGKFEDLKLQVNEAGWSVGDPKIALLDDPANPSKEFKQFIQFKSEKGLEGNLTVLVIGKSVGTTNINAFCFRRSLVDKKIRETHLAQIEIEVIADEDPNDMPSGLNSIQINQV